MNPCKGDTVLYTTLHDNIVAPATVVNVDADGKLDLFVMFKTGHMHKENVVQGQPGEPETWHPKQ